MWRSIDRKSIVFGLLILHIGWIGNHIRLNMSDEINPWRLGGYAMYTVPNPGNRVRVYDTLNLDNPIRVRLLQFEASTRFTNAGRTFRCAGIPAKSLRSFFNENPELIGRSLVFVFTETRFIRMPPSTERETRGLVVVTWQSPQNFSYTSRFCGREESQSGTL